MSLQFDDSRAILNPTDTTSPVENFPETVLVTFQHQAVEALLRLHPEAEAVSTLGDSFISPVYRFDCGGKVLGLFLATIGGPAAVGLAEEVWVKGAKTLLVFGSCGALTPGLTAGHLIVPDFAYRDEGTSFHYLPPSDYVEIPTARRLAEVFGTLGLPYVRGRTWTTDAIYRETEAKAAARRAEGCVAVEMECASLMAAGQFRGKLVYQFLYAEDSLAGAAWEGRTWGYTTAGEYERILRIAIETAVRL